MEDLRILNMDDLKALFCRCIESNHPKPFENTNANVLNCLI